MKKLKDVSRHAFPVGTRQGDRGRIRARHVGEIVRSFELELALVVTVVGKLTNGLTSGSNQRDLDTGHEVVLPNR